ncbi:MAG: Rpn family recombination-promoting nuclease/putative transposase [Acetatifactor sp.]|nr:Rpn family recombination-promoting nuclease/putative transposase [Acetatifactor sp.]
MGRKRTMGRFLPPKSDVAFKELMRNEVVRRGFISDVLDIPLEEIKSVRLENPFLSRRSRVEKQCILDVRIQLNDDSRINVELQIQRLAYWDKRSLFYLAKMYTDNLFIGQRYDRLKKCIVISIIDFAGDEHPGYHKVYHLRDQEGRLYSDQFEVHIIELNKELTGDKLDDWIRFFQVKSMGELNKLQSGNAGVMEAVAEVKRMNLIRSIRLWYEARLMYQRDQWAIEDAIREDSWNAGRAEGHEEGRAEGNLYRSKQSILDLLEELGSIPEDVRSCIDSARDTETLRQWLKFAAHAENFDDFRNKIAE